METKWLREGIEKLSDRLDDIQEDIHEMRVDLALIKRDKIWVFRVASLIAGAVGLLATVLVNFFWR